MVRCTSLALAACLVTLPAVAGEISGTVTHVPDGDTIEVNGQAVRLPWAPRAPAQQHHTNARHIGLGRPIRRHSGP